MNSNYRNQTASLMGHTNMYDDTYLRKRVKCLTSGLLLCFVIGVAAIGISVIVLLKLNKLEEDPAFASDLKNEIAELQLEVDILASQLQDYQNMMMTAKDQDNFLLDEDSPTMEKGLRMEGDSSNVSTHHDHHTNQTDHHVNDPDHHGNHTDHHEMHSNLHVNLTKTYENHTDHHNHTTDHHTPDVNERMKEKDEHIHHTHDESESSGDFAEMQPGDGTLCDDSDLCETRSGELGSIDEILEGLAIEGSGDECIQFARPVCPLTATICYTEDRCPVPICCFEGMPIDHLNYFKL